MIAPRPSSPTASQTGVDPTSHRVSSSAQVTDRYSVEVLRGVGTTDLREEKSESFTAGFAWNMPFTSAFDLTIGATYYDIRLRDEITQLGGQFSIDECYGDAQWRQPVLSQRNARPRPASISCRSTQQFINQDQLKARGVDTERCI